MDETAVPVALGHGALPGIPTNSAHVFGLQVAPRPIVEIAEKLGLSPEEYEPYGHTMAKVGSQRFAWV